MHGGYEIRSDKQPLRRVLSRRKGNSGEAANDIGGRIPSFYNTVYSPIVSRVLEGHEVAQIFYLGLYAMTSIYCICCQCSAELRTADCGHSCVPKWIARIAGWKQIKRSKNWYCCKCQIVSRWEVCPPPTADKFNFYVCDLCADAATASYQKDVRASVTTTFAEESPQASQGSSFAGQPSSSSSYVGSLARPMLAESLAGQPSSSSSYVGPLALPMLAEPDSDVLYLKPLQNLHGVYTQWSIDYMLTKCNCSMRELLTRATSKLYSLADHFAHGLPLSINQWGQKQQVVLVVDEWTAETSEERVRIMPGIISKEEEYPGKKAFAEKRDRTLEELFVRSQVTVPEETSDTVESLERHWRFDVLEQLMKSNEVQGRPLPSALDHLTLLQWNAGSARQRLDPGALSGGSLHFGMMQEVDPDIVASLERWGAIVHLDVTKLSGPGQPTCKFARADSLERSSQLFHVKKLPGPGQPTCTFARADFLERSSQLFADIIQRPYRHKGKTVQGWLLSYSIARYDFKFPIAGRPVVTIASAHLCNYLAKNEILQQKRSESCSRNAIHIMSTLLGAI